MKLQGFTPASKAVPRLPRLILSIQGLPKRGKTRFALTAPGPIALLNFDDGLEGVVESFTAAGKEIMVADHRFASGASDWAPRWARFLKDFHGALASPDVRTVVVDSGTAVWELLRLAMLGKLTQIMPVKYAHVNSVMEGLFRECFPAGKNVIWTHQETEEYANDKATGNMKLEGFKRAAYLTQANLRAKRDPKAKGLDSLSIEVLDSRHNVELAGEDFPAGLANFATIASMIRPDVPAEAWE